MGFHPLELGSHRRGVCRLASGHGRNRTRYCRGGSRARARARALVPRMEKEGLVLLIRLVGHVHSGDRLGDPALAGHALVAPLVLAAKVLAVVAREVVARKGGAVEGVVQARLPACWRAVHRQWEGLEGGVGRALDVVLLLAVPASRRR